MLTKDKKYSKLKKDTSTLNFCLNKFHTKITEIFTTNFEAIWYLAFKYLVTYIGKCMVCLIVIVCVDE